MLDRKGDRRGQPDATHASDGRGPRLRVLLVGALTALAVAVGLMGAIGAFASGGAPKVETERAEEVLKTGATMTGTVDPNGANTECKFEYGTVEGALNKEAPCSFAPG